MCFVARDTRRLDEGVSAGRKAAARQYVRSVSVRSSNAGKYASVTEIAQGLKGKFSFVTDHSTSVSIDCNV